MIAFKKNRTRIFLILKKSCFWNKKNSARTIFLKLAHFTHFKITGKCVKFLTSQKLGFQFPLATSRQSHEILKNPPRLQRRPRVLRVALLISRVDKISATQT